MLTLSFVEFTTATMKFQLCSGWALIVLTVLFAVTQQTPADPLPAGNLPVYGEPGEGRIRVETQGEGWHHPGIYWLPKDTPLAELLKRAGTPKVTAKDGEFSWAVSVKRGDKY